MSLSSSQAASFAKGGTLSLVISGTAGYDLVIDNFNFSFVTPTVAGVPEPASVALVGIGLLAGLGATRWKRRTFARG